MPLELPNFEDLRQTIVADYRARFPQAELSIYGDNYKRLSVLAGATWGLYYFSKLGYDDLFPDTAAGDALDRIGAIWDVTRKGATPARKDDSLRLTGVAASAFTLGEELTSASGLSYQLNESGSIPAGLFIDVDVIAIDTGTQTILDAGELLTFGSAPSGIDAAAELQIALDEGGEDQESDGAYRVRILDKIAQPAMGGNANDFVSWALEVDDISSAYVYKFRRGLGSIDIAVLSSGSGSSRVPSSAKQLEVFDKINDVERPVSVKLFRVLDISTLEIDVDLTVQPIDASGAFDWNDSTPPTVLAWTTSTRLMQLSGGARPADMAIGDRIVIKTTAGDGTGEQFEIEDFGAADEVILDRAPSPAPVATDTVYSGGALVDPLRVAVIDEFFDTLGPVRGDTAVGPWIDDVDPRRLESIALANTAVRTALTITPSVTAEPTDTVFPNDEIVELLIPGEIVIREKH